MELNDSHTDENLKTEILNVLEQCSIKVEHLSSVTTGNGANMLKSVKLLSENPIIPSQIENDNQSEIDLTNKKIIFSGIVIQSVRCAAHTLLLATYDA